MCKAKAIQPILNTCEVSLTRDGLIIADLNSESTCHVADLVLISLIIDSSITPLGEFDLKMSDPFDTIGLLMDALPDQAIDLFTNELPDKDVTLFPHDDNPFARILDKQFRVFPNLPKELRLKIWVFAIANPRTIQLELDTNLWVIGTHTPTDPLLRTCKESRDEILPNYKILIENKMKQPIYVRSDIDTIYFRLTPFHYKEASHPDDINDCLSFLTTFQGANFFELMELRLIKHMKLKDFRAITFRGWLDKMMVPKPPLGNRFSCLRNLETLTLVKNTFSEEFYATTSRRLRGRLGTENFQNALKEMHKNIPTLPLPTLHVSAELDKYKRAMRKKMTHRRGSFY